MRLQKLARLCCTALPLALGLCSHGFATESAPPPTPQELAAIEQLQRRVASTHLYASWTRPSCLSYRLEKSDAEKADIAIHELHNAQCGGDPATYPVVDRFRVWRKSGRIQWYNSIDGEYVAFSKVHSIGHR